MRLQLWTIYYAPEPTGIAPVTTLLARLLTERGWEVEVVAAHPHYPEPRWGTRLRPYREVVDGIRVLRIPLWIGRETAAARVRQEARFALALLASMPLLGKWLMKRPDAMLCRLAKLPSPVASDRQFSGSSAPSRPLAARSAARWGGGVRTLGGGRPRPEGVQVAREDGLP